MPSEAHINLYRDETSLSALNWGSRDSAHFTFFSLISFDSSSTLSSRKMKSCQWLRWPALCCLIGTTAVSVPVKVSQVCSCKGTLMRPLPLQELEGKESKSPQHKTDGFSGFLGSFGWLGLLLEQDVSLPTGIKCVWGVERREINGFLSMMIIEGFREVKPSETLLIDDWPCSSHASTVTVVGNFM